MDRIEFWNTLRIRRGLDPSQYKRWIVVLALRALAEEGAIAQTRVEQAIGRYLLQ